MMLRFLSVISLVCGLAGCVSLQNRGGLTDWAEDRFVFKADSKEMRVLRSYVILGSLARISSASPLIMAEREVIASQIANAVLQSYDALMCAKSRAGGCVFFDDRMANLDRSLLRLAGHVLLPEENKDLMAIIQKELFGGQIGDNLLGSAGKIVSAAGELTVTAGSAVNLVGSLMELGRNAAKFGGRFAPIYRDSVELRMRIVIDYFDAQCPEKYKKENEFCYNKQKTYEIWKNGTGDLKTWDNYSHEIINSYSGHINPTERHFAEVSELIIRSCEELVGGNTNDDEYSDDSKKCAAWPTGGEKRSLIYYKKLEKVGWETHLQ